jgi:hypothetical protein
VGGGGGSEGVSSTQTEISVLFVHKKEKCQLVIVSDFIRTEGN